MTVQHKAAEQDEGAALDFEAWRAQESEAFAEAMDLPGWHYRDLPNMTREFMSKFKDIAGDDNLRWITFAERQWKDGTETVRGQVMISPAGMEKIAAYSRSQPESAS